jgi:predicted RNA methylase
MAMEAENDLKFFPIKRRQLNVFRRLAAPHLKGRIADLGAGSGPYHREL